MKPTFGEWVAFYRLNRAPSAMFDVLGAGSFHALALAYHLDVFEGRGDCESGRRPSRSSD